MKNKIILRVYRKFLNHMRYYNKMAPFPVFDTEYVNEVENKINEIMNESVKDYDREPVVACRHCKSLHIVFDELDNNVCMRCGSVNELKEFKDIYEFKEWLVNKND
jgi:hypothetical protein